MTMHIGLVSRIIRGLDSVLLYVVKVRGSSVWIRTVWNQSNMETHPFALDNFITMRQLFIGQNTASNLWQIWQICRIRQDPTVVSDMGTLVKFVKNFMLLSTDKLVPERTQKLNVSKHDKIHFSPVCNGQTCRHRPGLSSPFCNSIRNFKVHKRLYLHCKLTLF